MDPNQVQQLISQLQNGTDQQRKSASKKLSNFKDPATVPALIRAYSDEDGFVRQTIIDGLRSIGSTEALDFLATLEASGALSDQRTTVLPASSNRRFLNLLIDTVLYGIGMQIVIWPITFEIFGDAFSKNFWPSYLYALAMLFLYYFVFEALLQKTPAKFITGTIVVMEDGSKPNASTIVKRTLSRLVPGEVISTYTGKLPDKKGTWWHDRWTATRVVRS
ncbi:MAG: RDD family protein [Anaerolineaceae bacterium]|nr:RDD family protein [Anaerolineaceae bacterium]